MARFLAIETARQLMMTALAAGAIRTGPHSFEWDVSGNCEAPQRVEIAGRPPGRGRRNEVVLGRLNWPVYGVMHNRCRRCPACMRQRAHKWALRAASEIGSASRTWFCTLTFAPEVAYRYLSQVRKRMATQGIDYDTLSQDDQFRLLAGHSGGEVTRYLKRVRKNTGAPMRYLLVAEPHRSGSPHFHLLVHEQAAAIPIRWAKLAGAWRVGFCQAKLLDPMGSKHTARYVSKYLAKSLSARVRASKGYGFPQGTYFIRG